MKIYKEQAIILRETAARLIKQAEELEAGINRNKCIHGKNTGNPVDTGDCTSCGKPTWIKCNNNKVVGNRVSSNVCKSCRHKELPNADK